MRQHGCDIVGAFLTNDGLRPMGRLAVPVLLECSRDLSSGRPDREHVEIREFHRLAGAEILVADITPADDRRLRIRGERLVVHPPVQASNSVR